MLARSLVTALAVLTIGAAVAPAETATSAADAKITPKGVGQVKLGRKHAKLYAAGLVGRQRAGCPLGGPGARVARLRAPLEGSVELTRSKARRAKSILVTGGAAARGVGIGDTEADILDAYPGAKVNHGTDETFGITLVNVPKSAGGKLSFAVDVETERITSIGVPYIAFCE